MAYNKGGIMGIDYIDWSKTKKKVEETINEYVYYCLSVDSYSTSKIGKDYTLDKLELETKESNDLISKYMPISKEERFKRVEFINYVRFSFNKLTEDERKMIYWTYFDKDNDYDDRFIANSLGFSLGYYYIRKKETLIRFAYALGVEEINNC